MPWELRVRDYFPACVRVGVSSTWKPKGVFCTARETLISFTATIHCLSQRIDFFSRRE